jgi:hypothetical protein
MTYISEKFSETHSQLPFGCSCHESANAKEENGPGSGIEPAWTFAQDMWVAANPIPGYRRGPFSPLLFSLHADHLVQPVYHVHQIALRFHHRVDGLDISFACCVGAGWRSALSPSSPGRPPRTYV